jgi:hypothetical protein
VLVQEEAAAVLESAVIAKERAYGYECGQAVDSMLARAELLWDLNQGSECEIELQVTLLYVSKPFIITRNNGKHAYAGTTE